jgi:SAM-dependent methyltransferase
MRELRRTFDEVAELYDRARPRYPPAVFDDLVQLAGLSPGDHVLEIGPGTGIATLPLAERGFAVTGVELGAELARVARRNLAAYPQVEILVSPFETWDAGDAEFDAVVAFTAFHWIDPAARYEKAARVLRPGGALAVVVTDHVVPDRADPFAVEVQEDYDVVVPSPDNRPPPHPDEVGDLRDEILASGRFVEVEVRRHLWEVEYTADEWIAVLETYSGHRSHDEATRERLNERIRGRIDARPSRTMTRTYLATLHVARRPA